MKKIIIGIIFMLMGLGMVVAQDAQPIQPPNNLPPINPEGRITASKSTIQVYCSKSDDVKQLMQFEKMVPIFLAQDGAKTTMVFTNPENKRWAVLFVPQINKEITCIAASGESYLDQNTLHSKQGGTHL